MTMKATTMNDFATKIEKAGGTIWHRDANEIYVTKGDRHVRVFFNADDRFYEATKVDESGNVLRVRDHTLRSMAAVERHLGI
jgi:hypothetical protein